MEGGGDTGGGGETRCVRHGTECQPVELLHLSEIYTNSWDTGVAVIILFSFSVM